MKLIHGDCLKEHEQIESGSVDLILTDLPYGTVKGIGKSEGINHGMKGKTEWDTVIDTDKIMSIANRVLRKNGKMVLFSQEPYTSRLITESIPNVPFSYRMIWEKDHYANALIAKKAPVSYFEDILIFSKNYDQEGLHPLREYFKNVYEFIGLNVKQIIEKIGQCADHTFRTDSTQFSLCTERTYNELIEIFRINEMEGFKAFEELRKKDLPSTFNLWEGNKYKSNILKYKKDYNGYHPTQKPVMLLEDLIKTFSNEGNLVVDLTMGSGSTGVACVNTNREFIGIELNEGYFTIAEKRIKEAQYQEELF